MRKTYPILILIMLLLALTGGPSHAAPGDEVVPTIYVHDGPLGLNYWAASALFLEPGQTYELRLTLTDPDGGGETRTVTATTRTEPQPDPAAGRQLYVIPGSGGACGERSRTSDGSAGDPFKGLQAAADAAQPGDVLHVAAGTYSPFQLLTSGDEGHPITFTGPGNGTAIVDGAGTSRGIVTLGEWNQTISHVIIEGLTIQNGHWGVDVQHSHDIVLRHNVIRDVDDGVTNRRGDALEGNQTVCDNVVEGRTPWPGSGIPSERGIDLRGYGNVVCHNTVRYFGDCISLQPMTGPSYGNDVYGNDASYCVDDGIEIDYNQANARADPTIPPVWDIVADDFESGTLDTWETVSAGDLSLVTGGGHNGSTGLSVAVGQSERYIYQTDVAKAEESYLTFWLDPNGVSIPDPFTWWPPGNSICVASVVGPSWWPPLVSLYVRSPEGEGYEGYLAWPTTDGRHYDYESGAFDLGDGWQKITLGYRMDEWVAVWVDDELVRYDDTTVVHEDPYGEIIEIGKTNENSDITPSGAMRFDEVAFQVPRVDDLWVDAASGDDGNDGLTATTAFRTIQKAADLAGPGTTVHILPGLYRETVWPAMSGSATAPALYVAEDGPGTVVIRGSEHASSLTWTQLAADTIGLPPGVDSTNIYYADLSAWGLEGPPRFIVELDGNGDVVACLPLAREPDWQVTTEWKHHQFWWAADGGSGVAGCDPATDPDPNCDFDYRSLTQLTDCSDDSDPPGVEPGNLTTLGDLTGATLVAIDTLQGHYVYRRSITAHDIPNGRLTVDGICEHDGGTGNPGLGWGSKYYVEGQPYLLDTAGEWWYDESSGRLYLWPQTAGNPATKNIEISRRDNGFNLRNRSYITLDGLTIEFLNGSAIYLANWSTHKSYDNTVRHVTLRYANWGAYIEQSVRADEPAGNVIDGFTLEDSEIAYMDTLAIRLIDWWEDSAAPDSFTRSGVLNTVIRDNEMHHLGFRTDGDNAVGASFTFANQLRIEGNHVHHVAHNGFQISRSVIQSPKTYGFTPEEIKTGGILIKDNVFEKACQLTTDCGALKIWGSPPDNHVFRDFLVTGNVFRDTFGWTYVSEKRGRWTGGPESEVRGLGGFGLYIDHASGVHAYRNISYNNAYTDFMVYGVWRDGDIVYVNNVAANSLYGMILGGGQYDTHGCVNTRVMNNIIVSNEAYGMSLSYAAGRYDNMTIDYNLYHNNGWRSYESGGLWKAGAMVVREGGSWDPYQTLADVQANTPWEDHGVAGDPVLWNYNPDDHDLHDGSWPDFHLTFASANAIDRGATALPDSLAALLDTFNVDDFHWGAAFDIGRYEGGFAVLATPSAQAVDPGGVAHYDLRLHPTDLPHTVTLAAVSPSPFLALVLSPTVVTSDTLVTLTVTDTHTGTLLTGLEYTIPITATGGGFTHTASVGLLVGGVRVHLPLVFKSHAP